MKSFFFGRGLISLCSLQFLPLVDFFSEVEWWQFFDPGRLFDDFTVSRCVRAVQRQ